MLVESKIAAWLTAGLALYRAHPLMIEPIFYDTSQVGTPTSRLDGVLVDTEKYWLPDEYAGGTLRWGGVTFPIVSNTQDTLVVEGDPSAVPPGDIACYQIVPKGVAGFTELLLTQKITVLTDYAQVPTSMPCIAIRLERDSQGDAYIGESLCQYAVNGVEFDVRTQNLTGAYLLSIWSTNREATLWLYAWLMTYALASIPQFGTWGFSDVALSGSDIDPAVQYLAERVYPRHLLLTATRLERAVTTRGPVEWVDRLALELCVAYQTFDLSLPAGR